jgi:hypothetical protein
MTKRFKILMTSLLKLNRMKLLWALLAVLLAIMTILVGTGKADAKPYYSGSSPVGFGLGGFRSMIGHPAVFSGRGYRGGFYG